MYACISSLIQHGELQVSNSYWMWLDQRSYAHSYVSGDNQLSKLSLIKKSHLSHLMLAAVCFMPLLCLLVCSKRRQRSSASSDRLSAKKQHRKVDPFSSAIHVFHLFTKYTNTSDVKRRVVSMNLHWSFYVWILNAHSIQFEAI